MSCTSSCPTQDCTSYGACLKNKGIKVAYCNTAGGADYTVQKKADKNLAAYANARKYGIQPRTTQAPDVQRAIQISDKTGTAFQA